MDPSTPKPTHAAFLRGVNLASRRRVSNDDLRAAFEQLGLQSVSTFRASGNVVFSARRGTEAHLRDAIEQALADRFSFAVPTYLRSLAQLQALVAADPFADARNRASRKLQVALLARRPPARERRQVLELANDEDLLSFGDRELLWLPTAGTQRSDLDLRKIEALIGPWTMRTMNTLEEIVARHFSQGPPSRA